MKFQDNILYLKTKDFSVTQESFDLHYNREYDMLLTFPRPENAELDKYYNSEAYISHTDSKKSLFDKVYQLVRKYTIQKKISLINSLSNKGTLLDIGCGTGDFLFEAQKKGWNSIGIEPNESARKIAESKDVTLYDNLAQCETNSMDVITLWHVLEHVSNLDDYMKELARIIKPTGVLIVAVPNYKSYDAKYYKEFWAAYDTPRHLWHFSKKSIDKLFSEFDFKLIKVLPMLFDSYYVSLLSEKYKNDSSNILNAIKIGFQSNAYGRKKGEYSSHIYVLKPNSL